jgi:CBS domain-containing protein
VFGQVTGVPVVKSSSDYTLVGVISKKDLGKKSGKTVGELMTSPPIAARPDNKVADAACLMLKHKVRRMSTSRHQMGKVRHGACLPV